VVRVVARGERDLAIPRLDRLPRRAGRALLRTLGQVTVFPGRPWVSFFHAFVFYGFVFYLLVNVVDAPTGMLPRAWLGALRFGAAATSSARRRPVRRARAGGRRRGCSCAASSRATRG
jgi:hypothetical protein